MLNLRAKKFLDLIILVLLALSLAGLNAFFIFPWFLGKGPANLGSIEVSYVSMARFIRDFFPHLSFAPYWYFGFPFHLFYTPLLPFLEALLNKLAGIPLWQTYRVLTGLGFVLTPASLFLLVCYSTRKVIPGILAALAYTFLPSLFYFILPSGEVAHDIINRGFWDPRRLVILVRWGEGPHTLSLAFLPLAGLFYLKALKSKKLLDMFLVGLFTGLTALTNAVGFYALILLLLSIFFSEIVKKPKSFAKTLQLSLLTALLAYGLIAFWYNLSFVSSFFGEGGGVVKNYLSLFPWGFLFILFGILILYFFFQKVIKNRAVIVSCVWFLLLFLIVYVYYTSAPREFSEQRLELVPQALRLMTEVDMAFSFLLASLVGALISFLEKKGLILKILINLIGISLVVWLLLYGVSYFPYSRNAVSGEKDLTKTGEYKIANWLKEHVDPKKGERVYVAGNYGFYLNYFTNVWQLRGGLFQAATHPWSEHIYYQISNGRDKGIALSWLKAANIKYLVVNTLSSPEIYKDFKVFEKFQGLKIIYQEQGDIIYEIPLNPPGGPPAGGPAKVVDLEAMTKLTTPKKADDKKAVLAYANWLAESAPAFFEVVNNDFYRLKADLKESQGVLVQMTDDEGFRAKSNRGGLKIKRDPLGFMVLTPRQSGSYEITLKHGKTWKLWLGYLITLGTVAGLLFSSIKKKLGKR